MPSKPVSFATYLKPPLDATPSQLRQDAFFHRYLAEIQQENCL
jgi:hypothetical protein